MLDLQYLILDTNIWIYISNGNTFKDAKKNNTHIKVFEQIKKLGESGTISILTNPIVDNELKRNENSKHSLVKSLNDQKQSLENELKNKQKLSRRDPLSFSENVKSEYFAKLADIDNKISENESHILEVTEFYVDHTTSYAISDKAKIQTTDQAIAKKAPFIGDKKNSSADMCILLGAIEFIDSQKTVRSDDLVSYPSSYFVSSNSNDFSSKEDKEIIHPDLKPYLDNVQMKYTTNIGMLINQIYDSEIFAEDEIRDIDDAYYDNIVCCPYCDADRMATIDFYNEIDVLDENIVLPDTNQLELQFPNMETAKPTVKSPYRKTNIGQCSWCGTEFIFCCHCGEMIETAGFFKCESCGTKYRIDEKYDRKGECVSREVKICKDYEKDNDR